MLDHHTRSRWDEERGLQTISEWESGYYGREQAKRDWLDSEVERRSLAEGWIGEADIRAIMTDEIKLLGRSEYDVYRLQWRFQRALKKGWPTELFPITSDVTPWRYNNFWMLPLPIAGRDETMRMLRMMAHRGLRTGSLPKAVKDVIRSRKIKGREEQSRVVTLLAK